jgi:LPPG:FO 2-phospho-L-lactate transferase
LDVNVDMSQRKIVALAGGVGGAKLVDGLAQCLPPENLTVIVNIGDDFELLGLKICPDLDTVCYTLAGMANPKTGWGLADETWHAIEQVSVLGGPDWFRLGDRDLGTHLERTRRLSAGETLSQITRHFCKKWEIGITVLPASDDRVPTWVYTVEGEMTFQEYFVHQHCRPVVKEFRFEGKERVRPAPGVLESLHEADTIIFCPSNPWVSIDPILAIPDIQQAVKANAVIAVSPIIGGEAVKGPAAKMYAELGIEPSALAVARHYQDLLDGFVFDRIDVDEFEAISRLGIRPYSTNTLMHTPADRRRLAEEVVEFSFSMMENHLETRPLG